MLLNDIQNSFKNIMLNHPRALDAPPENFSKIFSEGDIPLTVRLKVYRNNIMGSLLNVMTDTFPILHKLVGKEFFELMARSFILAHPPQQGYLSLYGKGFDVFVENFELARALPYLPDIARFEIALNEAYYAEDDHALTAADLATIPQSFLPEIRLTLRKNVRFVQSKFPLMLIRDFCTQPEGTLDISKHGDQLMISRPDLDVTITALSRDEWNALNDLAWNTPKLDDFIINNPAIDFQKFLEKHLALATFARITTIS